MMACPTCDHTMTNLFNGITKREFWCSRCGTVKTCWPSPRDGVEEEEISEPKLVNFAYLCSELLACAMGGESGMTDAQRMTWQAVREATLTPDKR